MDLRVLFIEDDETIAQNLKKIFDEEEIAGYKLLADVLNSFQDGIELIKQRDFDLVVLDLFKDKEDKDEEAGIKVLNEIRRTAFIPVIFYTGHAFKVKEFSSEIVGVVDKGDVSGGIKALTDEITRIINSKIATLKSQIYGHLKESLRKYFWDTVDANKLIFNPEEKDTSLGYLLLRRFADSFKKRETIRDILGDDRIAPDKVHPMEFYIYPINSGEYEAGEILKRNENLYILLTPSCDYVLRTKRNEPYRDVGRVLLSRIFPLSFCDEYKKHKAEPSKQTENNLKDIIKNKKSRFFFLPGTPFIENSVVDFQNKTMVNYEDLMNFERLTKLDDPYAQSMVTSFIRYYNRIGFPDIDSNYVIANL